jgi:monovalent cation/hydrogen antiporter
MAGFELALVLVLLLTAFTVVGRRFPWPLPLTYVLGGGLVSLIPALPRIELDPSVFFLCFVPPLLFADGWMMPLRDFLANRRQILVLATGLVAFTTVAIGFAMHALVPGLPLAMAFALGAIVSPTDAVAVGAILQRLKVPPRLSAILNGESMLNDATGLVGFNLALAAVTAGAFSLTSAVGQFLLVATGGSAVGLAIGWGVGKLRDLLRRTRGTDPQIEVTISLLTPFAAYLAANAFQLSAILAVVAAGLYSGWRDPLKMEVEERRASFAVWEVVLFWLNGAAFLLLGLQFTDIVGRVGETHSWGQLLGFATMAIALAVLTRIAWVGVSAGFDRLLRNGRKRIGWRENVVISWAGMRGTITLAAALSIPIALPSGAEFPGRDMVIFLAFSVTLGTLFLQGTTLEWVICKLGLPADDSKQREDRLARIAAVEAGLALLRERAGRVENAEAESALRTLVAEYEGRLAELTADGETRESASRRVKAGIEFQFEALRAERRTIDELWARDAITDETHRPLQQLLDHEEAMLRGRLRHAETELR